MPSAAEVTSDLLSGLQLTAICGMPRLETMRGKGREDGTHDATSVWAVGEFAESITGLAVVDEDLVVRACTGEVVSRGSIPDVLDEFRVCLDSLNMSLE